MLDLVTQCHHRDTARVEPGGCRADEAVMTTATPNVLALNTKPARSVEKLDLRRAFVIEYGRPGNGACARCEASIRSGLGCSATYFTYPPLGSFSRLPFVKKGRLFYLSPSRLQYSEFKHERDVEARNIAAS